MRWLLLLLCTPAFAQQNVILDAKGNAYMYTFRTGNQVVYTDSKGTPIAYSVPTTAPRAEPAWERPYPSSATGLLVESPAPVLPSLPALPTAAQMFPVPTIN